MRQLLHQHRFPSEFQILADAPAAGQVFYLSYREFAFLKALDHLGPDGAGGADNGNIPQFAHMNFVSFSQQGPLLAVISWSTTR
jgi:hypothetical protein